MPEFPAVMYKAGGTMLQWDGEWFDRLVVAKEDEYQKGLADGWSIGKPSAVPPLLAEPPAEPKRRGRRPKAAV